MAYKALQDGYGPLSLDRNYDLTIDDAIDACEVIPYPTNKVEVVNQPNEDNLDKTKKLKSLLDAGAITQTEYGEQKKKLLNQ